MQLDSLIFYMMNAAELGFLLLHLPVPFFLLLFSCLMRIGKERQSSFTLSEEMMILQHPSEPRFLKENQRETDRIL